MTSTPFTSDAHSIDGHPDVAEISALTEDLLSRERADGTSQAHLPTASLCADVHASLEEIRGSLGTLPGPVRMPADVAGRIDAALAAEALLDASSSDASAVSRETEPHLQSANVDRRAIARRTKRRHAAAAVSRETAVRAIRCARPSCGTSQRSEPPGTAPSRQAFAPLALGRPCRGRRGGRSQASAVSSCSPLDSPAPPPAAASRDDQERTARSRRRAEKQVQGLLAKQESAEKSQGRRRTPDLKSQQSPENNPLAGRRGLGARPASVRASTVRIAPSPSTRRPRTRAAPAILVVLPHRDDPQRVDAYVVDRSCVSGESTGPGEVLTTHTYPRR